MPENSESPEDGRLSQGEKADLEELKKEAVENGLDTGALDEERLTKLARYFDEAISFSRHIGSRVEKVEPGRAILYIDVEDHHLNGNGTLHGGVYASLIDNAMGISVLSKVGLRAATIQMDTRFLGPVNGGRIICHAEVLHRTRRMATAQGSVYDEEGNLVAMGTGTFRVFESEGVTSV
ncbi:PaaI family thioesterase [Rubrobacter aplysinae]|uniref:PaaI family thioesterase n=1 Tax=Rubrobacter aplysinae TaxID=909625 RepID=UPI00069D4571|nr:PaaI family thioesterase [Rubrobacter aplysinae]